MNICGRKGCSNTVKKEHRLYCSPECHQASRERNIYTFVCGYNYCENTFETPDRRRKYCSRSCSSNQRHIDSPNISVAKKLCTICGKKTRGCNGQTLLCRADYWDTYIDRWLAGEESGTDKYGLIRKIRDYIISLRGPECWVCGWNEVNPRTGRCPVQIDHIDGDAMNNRPENLRLLCPNHHSLTETFGFTGKKSTRTYRYPKQPMV